MKKIPYSLLLGGAVSAVTLILYFVITGGKWDNTMSLLSLATVLIAEGTTTLYATFAKGEPRRVAASFVSVLMFPISLILAFAYTGSKDYAEHIGLFFAAYILCNVVSLVLWKFDSHRQEENAKFQAAKTNMLYLRKIVKAIMIDPAAAEYVDDLNKIEEKLHFSNDNVSLPEDDRIYTMLVELQTNVSNPEFDVKAKMLEINKAIDIRNIMSSRS